jgi:hypothetical protein
MARGRVAYGSVARRACLHRSRLAQRCPCATSSRTESVMALRLWQSLGHSSPARPAPSSSASRTVGPPEALAAPRSGAS